MLNATMLPDAMPVISVLREERTNVKKKYVMKKMLHMHKKVCKNKYKAFSQLISRTHSY